MEPTNLNQSESWNKKKKSTTPTFPGEFIKHIGPPSPTTSTPVKMVHHGSKNLESIFEVIEEDDDGEADKENVKKTVSAKVVANFPYYPFKIYDGDFQNLVNHEKLDDYR